MKQILKKISYFFIMILILAVVKVTTKSLVKGVFRNTKQLSYEDSLNIYLNEFDKIEDSLNNALSGKQIDEYTILDSIQLSKFDTSIHYYYHINSIEKNEIEIEKFGMLVKPMIDSAVINNKKMFINKRFKTKFLYSYFDKKGDYISTIQATY